MRNPAVEMAYAIVVLHNEVQELRDEVEELREYRDKYMALLDSSIAHNQHMCQQQLGLVLALCERGGAEALAEAVSHG